MKAKIISMFFAGMMLTGIMQGQTLSPTVISSTGGFYTSSNAMLSFTLAEMTMVQTFMSAGSILTQGFQQPEDFTVGITENTTIMGDILIYPNPTNGIITLSYITNRSGENVIKLYNIVGQVMLTKVVSQSAGANTVTIDLGTLSQGIYILELNIINVNGEKQTNYSKINLVY
jgi:hypothetical protein